MDEEKQESVTISGKRGSIVFSRTQDGGLLIRQEIHEVDGLRDHLRMRSELGPVDARRVLDLLSRGRS